MSPLDSVPRHYLAQALDDGPWHCPACDVENSGPIAAGCASCGSGTVPARKAAPAAAPPTPSPTPPVPLSTPASRAIEQAYQEGYKAGYAAGIRAQAEPAPAPPASEGPDKVARTLIVALQLFTEQVLVSNPEEVITGEWMSTAEVENLIAQLQRGRA